MGWLQLFTLTGLVIKSSEKTPDEIEAVVRKVGGSFNLSQCGTNVRECLDADGSEGESEAKSEIYVLYTRSGGGYTGGPSDDYVRAIAEYGGQHWFQRYEYEPISEADIERMRCIANELDLEDKSIQVVSRCGRNGGKVLFEIDE